jgi:hypothetical protein
LEAARFEEVVSCNNMQKTLKKELRRMLNHLRDYKAAYMLFMNSQAERDLRPCKTKQKVSGCFRSRRSLEAFAAIGSYFSALKNLLATCSFLFCPHSGFTPLYCNQNFSRRGG